MTIDDIMRAAPVIPVLILDGSISPTALAETLVNAGLPVMEVTLRTPGALDAIREMARVPGAIVGAGTVLNRDQLDKSIDAGSRFIVSPGLAGNLSTAAIDVGIPFLPGIATAGDIMRGLDLGLDRFKFFPASAMGGTATLKALSAPFPDVRFCPTGGIRADTAAEWLRLDSVLCVGGTWLYAGGSDALEMVAERARSLSKLSQTEPGR